MFSAFRNRCGKHLVVNYITVIQKQTMQKKTSSTLVFNKIKYFSILKPSFHIKDKRLYFPNAFFRHRNVCPTNAFAFTNAILSGGIS